MYNIQPSKTSTGAFRKLIAMIRGTWVDDSDDVMLLVLPEMDRWEMMLLSAFSQHCKFGNKEKVETGSEFNRLCYSQLHSLMWLLFSVEPTGKHRQAARGILQVAICQDQ